MQRITLLQRLRPEIKSALEGNKDKYDSSISMIYGDLSSTSFYQDLKMSTIYSIYLFSTLDMYAADIYDIRWGDNLFLTDDELKLDTL